tara:strand:+ start:1645 stop:2370 length:726 start_codon:yes stop_codon:yes gene_type:complete
MSELVKFKKEYLLMVSRMTDQVFQLIKAGQTKDQILELLSKKDFKKVILADKEFKNAYNELNGLYGKALKNMDKFAEISPNTLLAITKMNQAEFFDKMAIDIATSLKGNMTSGILGGLSKDDIMKGVQADLRPDQIDTLVTTAISNYTASVNSLMADRLPKNVAYVYTGPVDKKTRPICLQLMSSGQLTRSQINGIVSNGFIERGGFNCRHQWRLLTKQTQMFDPKGAKTEAKKRGISLSG